MSADDDIVKLAASIAAIGTTSPPFLRKYYVVESPHVSLTKTEDERKVDVLCWRFDNALVVHPDRRALFDEALAKAMAVHPELAELIVVGRPPPKFGLMTLEPFK